MKRKIITIVISLLIVAAAFTGCKSNNINEEVSDPTTSPVLTVQESDPSNNDIIQKVNVCENFLKTYYSVSHSKSKAASLPDCRAYLTEQLYNKLSPSDEGQEYPDELVDVDYNSTISIKKTYQCSSDDNELIVRCTIKRTVNDMHSSNEYFVLCKVENINDEWLINQFELISVQGG